MQCEVAHPCLPTQHITILKAPGDDTGKLVLLPTPSNEVPLTLQPGESLLLQGAHVWHQANQSQLGCRVSLVVSLVPASVLRPDTTRVRLVACVGSV